MNARIYKNISRFSHCICRASVNKIIPLRINAQRNLRHAPRSAETSISPVNDSSIASSKIPDVAPSKSRTKPQYPSPIPALLPSEKLEQAMMKLYEDILAAPDLNTLFDFYIRKREVFELRHYICTLERLAELCRQSSVSIPMLHESQVFQAICYDVWKATSKLEATRVLGVYKYLQDAKVDSNCLIMQSLLQMARHQINLYTVKDLIFLHILLKRTEKCNLKDALQVALPRVIENSIGTHFPTYLKYKEMVQLLQLCIIGEVKGLGQVLQFIYKRSLPELLQDKSNPSLNKDLASLLSNLLRLNFETCELSDEDLNVANNLIMNCLNYLMEGNLIGLNKELLLVILTKLAKCFHNGFNSFILHEEFLAKIAEKSLEEKWDTKSLLRIIEVNFQMNYVSDELVSVVASSMKQISPDLPDVKLHPFISALASSDLPKETLNVAVDFVMKNLDLTLENLIIPWIRIVLNLLSMNYFDSHLLKRILDEDFLMRYLEFRENAPREFVDIVRLHRYLKAYQGSPELEVPAKVLSMAEGRLDKHPAPLLGEFLASIIGNSQCIVSNVMTPRNNFIDHIIILDEAGIPVEVSNDKIGEIFKKSENNFATMRKFAIIEVPKSWMLSPGNKLRGSFKLELQLIEQEGFIVVPIYRKEIEQLREAFKTHIKNEFRALGFNCVK